MRRVFVTGMPGSFQREASAEIARNFKWNFIHVGDLLDKEVGKKTDKGKKIQACLEKCKFGKFLLSLTRLVDDDIVTTLVEEQIRFSEKESKGWLVCGYPRTKVQSLAL